MSDKLTKSQKLKLFGSFITTVPVGILAVLAIIVYLNSTFGWFTVSRDVGSVGMSIKNAPSLFDLEVRGANVENSSTFPMADNTFAAALTTAGTDKIRWAKTGTTDDDGHYEEGLTPDSHGKLEFWVVSNTSEDLDVVFEFNIRGFFGTYTPPAVEGDDPILNDLFEITDNLTVTASNGLVNSADVERKKAALEYVKGHILFFSDFDGTYYSGFLGTGRSIRFGDCIDPSSDPKAQYAPGSAVSVTNGQKYKVTIYWKWANTFEQMVFDDDSPYADDPLFSRTNTADRTAMYNYLMDTANNHVFSNAAGITTELSIVQSGTNMDVALLTLTNAYDAADQVVGNNVDYILFEMTAYMYSE